MRISKLKLKLTPYHLRHFITFLTLARPQIHSHTSTVRGVTTQEKACSSDSHFRRKLRGTTGHHLLGTQRPQMLCVAAWVWFCLSTEFVVVPLVWSEPAATSGDDIPIRPAWSTSSTKMTGDWGVVGDTDAGAHLSSTGQTCPSIGAPSEPRHVTSVCPGARQHRRASSQVAP